MNFFQQFKEEKKTFKKVKDINKTFLIIQRMNDDIFNSLEMKFFFFIKFKEQNSTLPFQIIYINQ